MEKYKIEFHYAYSGRQVLFLNFEEPKLIQFYPSEMTRMSSKIVTQLLYKEIQELENQHNLAKAIAIKNFEEVVPILDSYKQKINSLDDRFDKIKGLLKDRYEQIVTRLVDSSILE
jgi:CRISPR/Cas system-associated endonuclease Cas1